MTHSMEQEWTALVERLRQGPQLGAQLPAEQGAMVRAALGGADVHTIAQDHGVSEAAVWDLVGSAARAAAGPALGQVETAGLGSDTDPGSTGGYGDTGFGSIGNEPPYPVTEEPPPEGENIPT